MERVLIVADDRTGALEVAGACAAAHAGTALVGSVRAMQAGPAASAGPDARGAVVVDVPRVVVVDLGSRHLSPSLAADAARAVDGRAAAPGGAQPVALHKIDSTLRGNWAAEVVARRERRGGRVLVVPALPELGRVCVDGEVLEHGRPVAEATGAIDARSGIRTSRPAELLVAAGVSDVAAVAPGRSLQRWLRADAGTVAPFAVCDATSNADLDLVAAMWSGVARGVLLAGTSASVAAAAVALTAGTPADVGEPPPELPLPWLVVAGSLHPTSTQQVAALRDAGAAVLDVPVGATPADLDALVAGPLADVVVLLCHRPPGGGPVDAGDAERAAATLASAAVAAHGARPAHTVVVLGGDTAAALLGDTAVAVGGTVAPGIPWGRVVAAPRTSRAPGAATFDESTLLVTKAGAFGSPGTLVSLLPPPERTLR